MPLKIKKHDTKVAWRGFKEGSWNNEDKKIDVRDFIQKNYMPYEGDEGFLASCSKKTDVLNEKFKKLKAQEQANDGVLDIDTETVSSLCHYAPGYLDKENEMIVGLQTDSPLKRGVNPFGGIRMAKAACEAYGYELSDKVMQEFKFRTTHNDGVFRVYTDEMKKARHAGIITGLPDAYGRGRIIGDYRRVALYGVDVLMESKIKDKEELGHNLMDVENIRLSEELYQQISFLDKMKVMAATYDCNIARPAENAYEATQWLYFAYLAAIKEQNGAAMSLGRVATFLDIYIERDLQEGTLDEKGAQELIDQLVLKLRMARHLRTPEYNELFAGDPMWITEALGGIGEDGRALVTKNTFRFINTLDNLTPAPEPNLTVLWSNDLPKSFKDYCTKMSIKTNALQYENDDLMRQDYGDDYAIACCVSVMKIGKQMQFFGARFNLPKLLLMALNGGKNEIDGMQVGPEEPIYESENGYLIYNEVAERFERYLKWLCHLYANTMNVIHYMHDKYAYEKTQMALHDTKVERFMAFGVAGLSVMADSLAAIKYAKVKPIKNEDGLITDFETVGDFPTFGNDDDRVDTIAVDLLERTLAELKKTPTYRESEHTLSSLTITSNVVYGKKTGTTPDGRKKGEPFAPGANPMHNREKLGALASLNSVAKLPYKCCRDGISNTFSVVPEALGQDMGTRSNNLSNILDGYFVQNAHHINVNVLDRERLLDAMDYPEKYPNLTIRVSGYAVNFHTLGRDQQLEVISRTFHDCM